MNDDELERRWAEVHEAVDLCDFGRAEALITTLAEELGDRDPEILLQRALLICDQQGPLAAVSLLDELLAVDPEHADGHYARGLASEEAGDHESMVQHYLEVLRLDASIAKELEIGTEGDLDFIETTAEQVLMHIPEEFRSHLRNVPIVLEERPHPDYVREGMDPRNLGLFEGSEQRETVEGRESPATPTRIVLFYGNLLADFPDRDHLAEEIEITMLHEIGHFFGLDEDDVERLGLE